MIVHIQELLYQVQRTIITQQDINELHGERLLLTPLLDGGGGGDSMAVWTVDRATKVAHPVSMKISLANQTIWGWVVGWNWLRIMSNGGRS
jgi:hypothetical protein